MKSLQKRMPALLTVMMLPILLFTFFSIYYSNRQMRTRIIETSASALDFYTQELDTSLNKLQSYLLNFSVFGSDTAGLNNPDHNERMLTQVDIYERLKQDFTLFDADFLFLYTPVYDSYVMTYSNNLDYSTVMALRKAVSADFAAYTTNYQWRTGRIGGNAYLYQINYSTMNGPCVYGALLDVKTVQNRLQAGSNDLHVYLTGMDNQPLVGAETLVEQDIVLRQTDQSYYIAGKQDHIVLHQVSQNGYILWETFRQGNFLWVGDSLFHLVLLLAVLVLIVLTIATLLIYRWVLRPLKGIEEGLNQLASGNLDYRLRLPGALGEYQQVSETFNAMTGQIRDLKIQVYEEKLHWQEAELNFLYMQMRPHFFLNALTTVTNFAKLGQYQNMYDFIGYLGRYIRYSLRRHVSYVTLQEELEHIDNYVAMQNLQHPDSVMLLIDAQEETLSCQVMSFMVYTFVENCMKHALSLETPLSIFVTASLQQEKLYLAIEDDSTGFPEEYLKRFSDPGWMNDPGEKHVGIRNVKKSLELLYKGEATLRCSNAEACGARVEIVIPAHRQEKEEGEKEN